MSMGYCRCQASNDFSRWIKVGMMMQATETCQEVPKAKAKLNDRDANRVRCTVISTIRVKPMFICMF